MGKRCAVRRESYTAIGLLFFSISIQAQSTPGFLSIDCGGSSYPDAVTSFSWEGDGNYISTGTSGIVPITVDPTLDNSEALTTFRYFPDGRSKYCYDLPTASNVSFLLRAMFLQGSAVELTLPISFNVAINGTTWFAVNYNIGDSSSTLASPIVHEGIFFSPGTKTHFCLVTGTGVPFISSLELRQLDPDGLMYIFKDSSTQYLSKLQRWNCGAPVGSPTVRYPYDTFDRLWYTPGTWSLLPIGNGTPATDTESAVSSVPCSWVDNNPDSKFSFSFTLDSSITEVYIAAYFEEIISNASTGDRLFQVEINEDPTSIGTIITPQGYKHLVSWHGHLTDGVNMTFTSLKDSTWGPILNAVEAYSVFPFNDSATATEDVDALTALQISFSLTDWQGDPCYPVSWDWVSCTGDVPARVDKLLLSNKGINAAIPSSISTLTALTEIHLNNNSLHGSIPEFLASPPYLTFLSLNNNNLSGDVPPDLLLKLGSNFDYDDKVLDSPSHSTPGGPPWGRRFLFTDGPFSSPSPLTVTPPPLSLPSPPTSLPPAPLILPLPPPGFPATETKSTSAAVIGGAVAGAVVLVTVVFFVIYCLWTRLWRSRKQDRPNQVVELGKSEFPSMGTVPVPPPSQVQSSTSVTPPSKVQSSTPVKPPSQVQNSTSRRPAFDKQPAMLGRVSYETVQIATDNFNTKLGEGSYGAVYRGSLNDKEVAVKLNNIQSHQGHQEFIAEVDILTRVHHRNIVSLIAYCDEGNQLILIYEFEVNGTLREWLYRQDGDKVQYTLDWKRRLQIASDAAKGLEYLHTGCNPPIIHRDVKSNNILLDASMTAKVADFGLSKSIHYETSSGVSTQIKGTPGYLDPEYYQVGKLTRRSDVFSYGVVLAEIITGSPPCTEDSGGKMISLGELVDRKMKTNDMEGLADPNLQGAYNPESMWKMAELVRSCIDPNGALRPDFTQVVIAINEAIEYEKSFATHSPALPSSGSLGFKSNPYQSLK